jgi:hypothetical protein
MDFVPQYLDEILLSFVGISLAIRCLKLLAQNKELRKSNSDQQLNLKTMYADNQSLSQKYALALKTIKEKQEANLILIDQLANVVTFNLITNTEPKPNASVEYYKLSDKDIHYFFTPHEVGEARKRANKNPEDTANS